MIRDRVDPGIKGREFRWNLDDSNTSTLVLGYNVPLHKHAVTTKVQDADTTWKPREHIRGIGHGIRTVVPGEHVVGYSDVSACCYLKARQETHQDPNGVASGRVVVHGDVGAVLNLDPHCAIRDAVLRDDYPLGLADIDPRIIGS